MFGLLFLVELILGATLHYLTSIKIMSNQPGLTFVLPLQHITCGWDKWRETDRERDKRGKREGEIGDIWRELKRNRKT